MMTRKVIVLMLVVSAMTMGGIAMGKDAIGPQVAAWGAIVVMGALILGLGAIGCGVAIIDSMGEAMKAQQSMMAGLSAPPRDRDVS